MAKKFHHSYVVCKCKNVTLGEMIYAIKEKGAKTVKDIKKITEAGTACGCCVSKEDDYGEPPLELHIKTILDKFVNKN